VLIDKNKEDGEVILYLLNEVSGNFAYMRFHSIEITEKALMQNGFKKHCDPIENNREFMNPFSKPCYLVRRSEGQQIGS
jgi:hypothetical protein